MDSIHHILQIEASFDTVFTAISTVEGMANWWTEDISGNEQLGGNVRVGFGMEGEANFRVVDYEENKRFQMDFVGSVDDEWYGTTIKWFMSRKDMAVRIDFQHANFKTHNDAFAETNYTWGRLLTSLKNYCEIGVGDPLVF